MKPERCWDTEKLQFGSLTFYVPGTPRPGGSKRSFAYMGKDGKPKAATAPDSKHVKAWMSVVQLVAHEKMRELGLGMTTNPVRVQMEFLYPRPNSHYGTGKNAYKVKPSVLAASGNAKATAPDLTKIVRSTEDALTGIVWKDDRQVVEQLNRKSWGPIDHHGGALILVEEVMYRDAEEIKEELLDALARRG